MSQEKILNGFYFFQNSGARLALYPHEKLAEDIDPNFPKERSRFSGITLAHNTRTKNEVDEILELAEKAGGKIGKPAQIVHWGEYSGYFSD